MQPPKSVPSFVKRGFAVKVKSYLRVEESAEDILQSASKVSDRPEPIQGFSTGLEDDQTNLPIANRQRIEIRRPVKSDEKRLSRLLRCTSDKDDNKMLFGAGTTTSVARLARLTKIVWIAGVTDGHYWFR
jgi:hypothetical protein